MTATGGSETTATNSSDGSGSAARRGAFARNWGAASAIIVRDLRAYARRPTWIAGNLLLPAVLLLTISSGFGSTFGRLLLEPYNVYVVLLNYLVPGLASMVVLLATARATLLMVEPRGPGSMRPLLTTSSPLASMLAGKLAAAAIAATIQAYLFVLIAGLLGSTVAAEFWLRALPAIVLGALMAASLSFLLLAFLPGLRRLSTFLLIVLLPAVAVSSALYPLSQFDGTRAEYVNVLAQANPFTHVIELIRNAGLGQLAVTSLAVVLGVTLAAFLGGLVAVQRRWVMSARSRRGAVPAP